MSGCNKRMPVTDEAKIAGNHTAFCDYYLKGYGDCTCGAAMILCGKEVVRDGKCEEHKVERRGIKLFSDRRKPGTSDTPVPCGNSACHWLYGEVRHDLMCPDRGPGWA